MSGQAFAEPDVFPDLEIERFADGDGTLGWLVRYGAGFAIWCGELSRAEFVGQPLAVRQALRDDLGWYLVEIDLRSAASRPTRILARVAREDEGLDLATAVALGRRIQRTRDGTCVQAPLE